MTGFLLWAGAICPVLILFFAISVLRLKTEKAAFMGLFAACLMSFVLAGDSFKGVAVNVAKGGWNAFSILFVIWPAIILYGILKQADAFQAIKEMALENTKDELFLILLFCWLFSSFLQGITGFGVPVAVCAPLLMALGVKPVWAVVITLMGHAWANTFGTFALGWDALAMQAADANLTLTFILSCLYLAAVDFVGPIVICGLYGGKKAIRHMLPFTLLLSLIHGGGQLVCCFVNTTVAAFLPTTAALAAAVLVLKAGFYRDSWSVKSQIMEKRTEAADDGGKQAASARVSGPDALLPFGLLVVLSILILMVKPIHDPLNSVVIQLSFPETVTVSGFVNAATNAYGPLHIFAHAGFILILVVCATWIYFIKKGFIKKSCLPVLVKETLQKAVPASLGILFLVMMAQVLKGSGLMEVIAGGVSAVTGSFYGFAAPFMGLLGAFITSSNTSSNILLGGFQVSMASILGMEKWKLLAAQTAGGAIGTIVGPSTILLGTTTAGCRGQEGWVLKKVIPLALTEAFVVGAVSFALSML